MYMDKITCDQTKIFDQASRTEGQISGVAKMIKDGRSCSDVLQQIVAARANLQKLGIMLLEAEAAGCLGDGNGGAPKMKELEHVVANLFKIT